MRRWGWLILASLIAAGGWWVSRAHTTMVCVPSTFTVPHMNIDVQVIENSHNVPIWSVRHSEGKLVSVCACFKFAGYAGASHQDRGISDVLASLLDEGYKGMNGRELKLFLLNNCIDYSASADNDHITLTMRTVSENLPQLFKVLTGIVTSPLLLEDDSKRIQEQLSASLEQQLHLPQTLAADKRAGLAFGADHPYAFSVVDQAKRMNHWKVHHIKDYAHRMFTRKRLHVVVVGSFKDEDMNRELNAFIQALPEGDDVPTIKMAQSHNDGSVHVIHMPVPQSVVTWTQEGLDTLDPQFYALYLANDIIGGGGITSSRLMNQVREKNGLAYGIGSRLFSELCGLGWFGRTGTQTENVQKVMDMVRSIWKEVSEKGVTKEELEQSRSYTMQSYPHTFTSTKGIARMLMRFMLNGRSPDYASKRNEYFEKVTHDDVNKACREFMKQQLTFVVVGKHEAGALK